MIAPTTNRRMCGFTLVELLVSTAVLSLVIVLLVAMTNQASGIWRYTAGKAEQFQAARAAFDTVTTRLSQATLNTYWEYFDASGNPRTPANSSTFVPVRYGRQSELRFLSGRATDVFGSSASKRVTHAAFFHAPFGVVQGVTATAMDNLRGMDNLLNAWGYYVEFQNDETLRPSFVPASVAPLRYRFRLMEFMQPTQNLKTYQTPADWFQSAVDAGDAPVHVLAENIVALIIRPKLSQQDNGTDLTTNYVYDTTQSLADPALNPKNQLPPVVQVTMVAIDEISANRLNLDGTSTDIFNVQAKFKNPAKFDDDLLTSSGSGDSLEDELAAQHVSYRVFTTNVPIHTAKWSTEQAN